MTAITNNTRREQIEFPPNVPVVLALAYGEPKRFPGAHGERCMFTTTENKVAFLDPSVAGKITELGINIRESFSITRKTTGKRGAPDEWIVERIAGEQPNGTFAVPRLPDAAPPPTPKPIQRASTANGSTLTETAIELVDSYAAVLDHALTKHQGRVKPDEVRAIFLTAAINGRGRAA